MQKYFLPRLTAPAISFDRVVCCRGVSLNCEIQIGVVFFQHEHQHVFGQHLGAQGHLMRTLSYGYRFSLQEMKEPLKQAVVQADWSWQPVAWNAPSWLRRLTE